MELEANFLVVAKPARSLANMQSLILQCEACYLFNFLEKFV